MLWVFVPFSGTEFLKLLKFPKSNKGVFIFITNPFQSHLGLCNLVTFGKHLRLVAREISHVIEG